MAVCGLLLDISEGLCFALVVNDFGLCLGLGMLIILDLSPFRSLYVLGFGFGWSWS